MMIFPNVGSSSFKINFINVEVEEGKYDYFEYANPDVVGKYIKVHIISGDSEIVDGEIGVNAPVAPIVDSIDENYTYIGNESDIIIDFDFEGVESSCTYGEQITDEEIMTTGTDNAVSSIEDSTYEDLDVATLFEISDEDMEQAEIPLQRPLPVLQGYRGAGMHPRVYL